MDLKLAIGATVTLLAFSQIAFGQSAPSLEQRLAPTPPHGVPGFFEPSTQTFTPLAFDNPKSFPTYDGTVIVKVDVNTRADIDTLFCVATLDFGNLVGGQEFSNHSAGASVNFSAASSDNTISVPYTYVPNTSHAYMRLTVSCRATDSSGRDHSISMTLPEHALVQNGFAEQVILDLD